MRKRTIRHAESITFGCTNTKGHVSLSYILLMRIVALNIKSENRLETSVEVTTPQLNNLHLIENSARKQALK